MRASLMMLATAALCLTLGTGAAGAAAPVTTHRLSGADAARPETAGVVMNPAGSGAAVWSAGTSRAPRSYVALRNAKGAWSAAHALNAKGTRATPFAGIDRAGRVVVVWGQGVVSGGGDRDVFWTEHRPDGSWTKARRISVPARSTLSDFRLAADGTGVASLHTRGAAYVRVLTHSGTWRPAVAVSQVTNPPNDATAPSVSDLHAVVTASGAVTAVWGWSRMVSRDAYCVTYQRGGLDASGRALATVTLGTKQCSAQPLVSLTESPAGDSVAAYWVVYKAVHVVFRMPGGTWQAHTLPTAGDSAAAVAMEGNRMWVWTAVTTTSPRQRTTISATRYRGHWGPAKTVYTYRTISGDDNTIPAGATITAVLTRTQQTVVWSEEEFRNVDTRVRSWVHGSRTTQSRLRAQNEALALAAGGRHRVLICEAPVKPYHTFRYYTQDS